MWNACATHSPVIEVAIAKAPNAIVVCQNSVVYATSYAPFAAQHKKSACAGRGRSSLLAILGHLSASSADSLSPYDIDLFDSASAYTLAAAFCRRLRRRL